MNEGIAPRGAIDHSGFYQTEPMPTCDDLTQAQRDRAFASHYGYDSSFTEQDVRELIPWVEEEEAYICATALGWEPQRYYWENPEIRRGLFVDSEEHTYVYSFSEGGVMVHDVDAPDAALGSASLPQAQWSESECYGCGDWGESDNGFGGQPVLGTPGGPDFEGIGEGSGTTTVDPEPADPEPDVEEMEPEIDTIVPDDNGPADVKALCEETCGAGLGECVEDSRQHTSCYEDCVARAQRADGVCQSSLDRLLACCADNGGICRDGEPSVQEPFCAAVCPEASATFDLCIE